MNLELLEQSGLLFELFPELRGLDQQEQDAFWHPEGDVWTHTKLVVAGLPKSPMFFFAGLFHDVGKLTTSVNHGDGRVSAHGHEKASAEVVDSVMRRLKVSNDLREKVVWLVRHHMKAHSANTQAKTLRKLLREQGEEMVRNLLVFGRADVAGASNDFSEVERLEALLEEVLSVPAPAKPVLSGHDVMELGVPKGPLVGQVMRMLQDNQDENPELSAEEAVALVQKFIKANV